MQGNHFQVPKIARGVSHSVLHCAVVCILIPLTACAGTTPAATQELIHVQYSFSTEPWLKQVSNCAAGDVLAAELRAADFQDAQSVDMVLRLSQAENPMVNAYQIGTEDVVVIVNQQHPDTKLTIEQVRGLFTGQIVDWKGIGKTSGPVQVWVFPSGEDVQQIFNTSILEGSGLTTNARLANDPEEMIQAIEKDSNAIGIIGQHWVTGKTQTAFTVATNVPILAVTASNPQSRVAQIITCLQNKAK